MICLKPLISYLRSYYITNCYLLFLFNQNLFISNLPIKLYLYVFSLINFDMLSCSLEVSYWACSPICPLHANSITHLRRISKNIRSYFQKLVRMECLLISTALLNCSLVCLQQWRKRSHKEMKQFKFVNIHFLLLQVFFSTFLDFYNIPEKFRVFPILDDVSDAMSVCVLFLH